MLWTGASCTYNRNNGCCLLVGEPCRGRVKTTLEGGTALKRCCLLEHSSVCLCPMHKLERIFLIDVEEGSERFCCQLTMAATVAASSSSD